MRLSTEKRTQDRLQGVFPVFLRSTDSDGEQLQTHTLADNVSPGGLYLQLPYALTVGTKLSVLIALPSGAKLAAYCLVLRAEQKNQTLFGMALSIRRCRLFSACAV